MPQKRLSHRNSSPARQRIAEIFAEAPPAGPNPTTRAATGLPEQLQALKAELAALTTRVQKAERERELANALLRRLQGLLRANAAKIDEHLDGHGTAASGS